MYVSRDEVLDLLSLLLDADALVSNLGNDAANSLTKRGEMPGAQRMLKKARDIQEKTAQIRERVKDWQREAELDERRGDNRKSVEALRDKARLIWQLADERELREEMEKARASDVAKALN